MNQPQKHNNDELLRLIESATAPADAPAAPRSSAMPASDEGQLRAAWLALGNLIEQAGMAADKLPATLEELASRKPEDLPRPRSLEPAAPPARSGRTSSRTDSARWRRLQWVVSAAVVLLITLWAFPRLYQLNLKGPKPGPAKVATVDEPQNGQPGAGPSGATAAGNTPRSSDTSAPMTPTTRDSETEQPADQQPSRAIARSAAAPSDPTDSTGLADQWAWDDQLDEMIWAAAEATAQIDYGALAQTAVLSDRLDQLRLDLDGNNF